MAVFRAGDRFDIQDRRSLLAELRGKAAGDKLQRFDGGGDDDRALTTGKRVRQTDTVHDIRDFGVFPTDMQLPGGVGGDSACALDHIFDAPTDFGFTLDGILVDGRRACGRTALRGRQAGGRDTDMDLATGGCCAFAGCA